MVCRSSWVGACRDSASDTPGMSSAICSRRGITPTVLRAGVGGRCRGVRERRGGETAARSWQRRHPASCGGDTSQSPRRPCSTPDGDLLAAQAKVARVGHHGHRGAHGVVVVQGLAHALRGRGRRGRGDHGGGWAASQAGAACPPQHAQCSDAAGSALHGFQRTMKTMLRMRLTRPACTSCSTISPAVRSAVRPMVPAQRVAQQGVGDRSRQQGCKAASACTLQPARGRFSTCTHPWRRMCSPWRSRPGTITRRTGAGQGRAQGETVSRAALPGCTAAHAAPPPQARSLTHCKT